MTKKLLAKVSALALITSVLLPPFASAQLIDANTFDPPGRADTGLQEGLKALEQERQADKDASECKPNQAGIGGLAGSVGNSLQNVIGRGLQRTFSQTLGNIIQTKLQGIIQQQLSQTLPRVIENQLSQELPGLLRSKISSALASGQTQEQVRNQIPQLMQSAVQEILPHIASSLPGALETGIRGDLRNSLAGEFQNQIPSILQNDQLPSGGTTFAQSLHTMVSNVAGNLPNTGSGQINVDQLTQNIQGGIATSSAQGIASGAGLDRLLRQIMPFIMRVILQGISGDARHPGIANQLNTALPNGLNHFSNSGGFQQAANNFNFNSFAGNNITAAVGFDMTPVSQAIAHPLALATVSGLGVSGYDHTLGSLANVGYNGPVNVQVLQGANSLDNLTPAGQAIIRSQGGGQEVFNDEIVQDANLRGEQAGTLATDEINNDFSGIGTDAAGGVDGNAIASNATSGLGGQIGNSLKGGLANGLAGGVGNLVDGIPVVGGLLSPIAEDIAQLALNEVLGVTDVLTGLPTQDFGVHQAVIGGAKSINKTLYPPISKTEQHTKLSNDNEAKNNSIALNNCLKNKATLRATQALEAVARVENPAAWRGSIAMFDTFNKVYQAFRESAVPDRLAPNGEGQSTNADLTKNKEEAGTEGIRQQLYAVRNTNNPNGLGVTTDLIKATTRGSFYGSSLTQSQKQEMANPDNLSDQEFLSRFAQMTQPANDERGVWLTTLEDALTEASKKRHEEEVKFVASGGFNPIEDCLDWVDIDGAPVCLKWKVRVPGSINAATQAALSTFGIHKAENAHSFQEDGLGPLLTQTAEMVSNPNSGRQQPLQNPCPGLDPCQPGSGFDTSVFQNIRTPFTGFNPLSLSDQFNQSLSNVMTNGLNNLAGQGSGLIDSQINSLTGHLESGIRGAGFTRNDFSGTNNYGRDQKINDIIIQALGQTGINQGQSNQTLISAIAQIIIQLLSQIARNQ